MLTAYIVVGSIIFGFGSFLVIYNVIDWHSTKNGNWSDEQRLKNFKLATKWARIGALVMLSAFVWPLILPVLVLLSLFFGIKAGVKYTIPVFKYHEENA